MLPKSQVSGGQLAVNRAGDPDGGKELFLLSLPPECDG